MFLQKYKGDVYMISGMQTPKASMTISQGDFEGAVPAGEGAAKSAISFLKKAFAKKEAPVEESPASEKEPAPASKAARIRLTKLASITTELDKIAEEVQEQEPQAALALDRLSDILEDRINK